ncbi:MAG: CRISPR-associated endonuclease Cas1 [Gemmatimonadaceae bacterium]|nr:CRISPR-associated endonuclease Cas1 [Gemmatimonadaceae bacterium]MCW5826775.1 CRISPR-associated endonuclease Cas1 [Gemmatimonadaceae bacterium]
MAESPATLSPDLVPARMVNEFVYCPRLAYLEWVQGEWDDNLDTIQGRFVHRRVDDEPATDVPAPEEADPECPQAARSVMLSSPELGAIARMDLMEVAGKRATPVDYKRGVAPDLPQGAYDPERVQLCLQGLILRDNGYECDSGVLYFAASKTRVEIPFDDELVRLTRESVEGLRKLGEGGRMPPPLVDSAKCVRCSLAGICLPDEVNRLAHPELPAETRRLVPARDDRIPLYVQAQGGTIGKRDERLNIYVKGQPTEEVRLMELSHVAVFGNVQVTTQALRALCDQDTAIAYLSYGGWFYGMTTGLGHKNVELRIAQHRTVESGENLAIARAFVSGKILNQRTLLRRNLPERDVKLVGRLAVYARQARHIPEVASLLGVEGMAAKLYFEGFSRLFRGAGAWAGSVFAAAGRNRRPPRDEVNAVLSFLYAMLTKDCTLAVHLVGFDGYRGFYHAPKYGRPALALDLCEEFRSLVADSTCITLFNQGEVTAKDFVKRARGVALTPAGRRAVIAGYERRMNQLVTHPVFGYTISYRRVVEVQARLLRATVLGEVPAYRPFTTR